MSSLVRTLVVLNFGFVVAGMATTMLGPLLPLLTARWHITDAAAGTLFSAQFLSSMTATVLSPTAAAKIGSRSALALGFLLMGLGAGIVGVAPFGVGVAGTAMYGLGLGLVLPLTNIVVAALLPMRAASALSLVNVSWGVGAVLWPLVVAALARTDSVAAATTALAIACGIQMIAMLVALPPTSLPAVGDTEAIETSAGHQRLRREALMFGTMILLYVGAETAIGGWVAEYARRMKTDGGDRLWALAPTAFWGAQTAGRLLAPLALARVSEHLVVQVSLVTAAAALVGLLLAADTPAVVVAGAAAAGFGLAALFPLFWAAVTRSISPRWPSMSGPLFASGGLGGALLPWLVGVCSSAFGDLRAGLVIPLVALLAILTIVRREGASAA